MQTNATFSVVISTKNHWRAPKLATDSSLNVLSSGDQHVKSSRVMNHAIAENQPLHWLRLFHDITSEQSRILFVQPAMSKNRTIFSLDQRIEVLRRVGEAHHVEGLLPSQCGKNANGTYDIEANRDSHRGLH